MKSLKSPLRVETLGQRVIEMEGSVNTAVTAYIRHCVRLLLPLPNTDIHALTPADRQQTQTVSAEMIGGDGMDHFWFFS